MNTSVERFATLTPPSAEAHIIFHTDSSYVINGITLWVAGWKRNSWLTKQKQQVLNRDIWEALDAAVVAVRSKITWEHVGGHVGIAGNERADEIASGFAEGMAVKLFSGARSEYTHNIENISHDATKLKQRSASKSRSGAKAYSYISAVGGVVLVHKTWDECKKRVEGKKARFKKALSTEDEAKIIQEFS